MEINCEFATFEEFKERLESWRKEAQQTLVYKTVEYRCIHEGDPRFRGEETRTKVKSRKTGCPVTFKILGSSTTEKIIVTAAPKIEEHTSNLKHFSYERENRILNENEVKEAEALAEKYIKPSDVSTK